MFNHLLTCNMDYLPPCKNKPVHGNMSYRWVQCDDRPAGTIQSALGSEILRHLLRAMHLKCIDI